MSDADSDESEGAGGFFSDDGDGEGAGDCNAEEGEAGPSRQGGAGPEPEKQPRKPPPPKTTTTTTTMKKAIKAYVKDPDISHLTSEDYQHVYCPSEDTFLLLDALNIDTRLLADRFRLPFPPSKRAASAEQKQDEGKEQEEAGEERENEGKENASGNAVETAAGPTASRAGSVLCVEVGVGSAMVLTHAANVCSSRGYFLGVDINSEAALRAKRTLGRNGIPNADVIVSNLLGPVQARLQGAVDILIFNPPYVPTPSSEVVDPDEKKGGGEEAARDSSIGMLSAAWAGGSRGREVLDKLLPVVPTVLSAKGVFYLVAVPENDPKELESIMSKYGFTCHLVCQRRAFNEDLRVYRYERKGSS